MGAERLMAGFFTGVGALLLIGYGMFQHEPLYVASGTGILGTLVGFFVGEHNGIKKSTP